MTSTITCVRCGGHMIPSGDGEIGCMNCGARAYQPDPRHLPRDEQPSWIKRIIASESELRPTHKTGRRRKLTPVQDPPGQDTLTHE